MKKASTMRDIAEKLGISVVSVSKALNDKEGISLELREKIIKTADEMGYKLKDPFKRDAGNATIGILIANYFLSPAPAFYWSVYEEVVRALKNQGYYCMLEIIEPQYNLSVPAFLAKEKVEGIIVIGYVPSDYLAVIDKYEVPLVMLDFYNEDVKGTSVMPDNNISTCKMMHYLLSQGHRDIAFVGSIFAAPGIMDRYLGYYKTLLENNIPLRQEWVIPDRGEDMVIFREFALPEKMPTAFVCNCDQTAYYLVEYLTQQGYRVPEDVSVTGFYNYSYAKMCKPPLTTVNVDIKDLANLAVNALLNRMPCKNSATDIILAYGKILPRDSVKNIKND